jgi:hypothetical protein
MVHITVEDVIASFPHHLVPTVQSEPDYHTIHSIRKLLRPNDRSIESHLRGGALGHLGTIISIVTYTTVAPIHPWVNQESPGGAPNNTVGCTTRGTSSLGGGCKNLQNLDNYGASLEKNKL